MNKYLLYIWYNNTNTYNHIKQWMSIKTTKEQFSIEYYTIQKKNFYEEYQIWHWFDQRMFTVTPLLYYQWNLKYVCKVYI